MKQGSIRIERILIIGLLLTGLLFTACTNRHPGNDLVPDGVGAGNDAPLVLQALDYTENAVDIPNPDRGTPRRLRHLPENQRPERTKRLQALHTLCE